jgi:3-hydroxyacyl-CoA dehydrogenase
MTGLDILASTDRVISRAFPRHGCLSPLALRLVDGGHLGQKTGSGVYKYQKGDYTPHENLAAEQILAEVRQKMGLLPRDMGNDEITRRLVLRMVDEAFYAVQEELTPPRSDLDVATVLGVGFPDFRGGVLKYAYDLGLGRALAQLDQLAERCGERFSPCQLLRESGRKEN